MGDKRAELLKDIYAGSFFIRPNTKIGKAVALKDSYKSFF